MDYEKKYKEALERAKRLHCEPTGGTERIVCEQIFPELKESDDDKIRKEILELVRQSSEVLDKQNQNNMIAWLEKQGEHANFLSKIQVGDKVTRNEGGVLVNISQLEREAKPRRTELVDKVEPKFHEGDWVITRDGKVNQVIAVDEDGDGFTLDDDTYFSGSWKDNYHLWTIKDAKDGDVLCYKDEISLYKHDIKNCTKQETTFGGFVYYCCYDGKRFITDSLYSLTEQDKMDIHPATKEQRDLLFQKMKKFGYEWDTEKKELKKIGNEIEIPFGAKDSELREVTYYIPKGFHAEIDDDKVVILKGEKPAEWSEEDESMLECALDMVKWFIGRNETKCRSVSNWLKSLKQRIGG